VNVLDLFSGIGGFSLGLERAGMRTVAFCEIDPFCRKILAKHWPGVPCYDDVRTLTAYGLATKGIVPDVICGGFPCQDISSAGQRVGITGPRSGLWTHYARLIGELRPAFVIVENVADLRYRGLDDVLGDLAALGYDAEWHCIPAAAVDAPHFRDRLWIVAHPNSRRLRFGCPDDRDGREVSAQGSVGLVHRSDGGQGILAYADSQSLVGPAIARAERNPWPAEPAVDRLDDGLSADVAREQLRALGNAVVPQIPEIIGRAIMRAAQ
jgi:DNA (cytosine-5)-methyltransferase 1